MQTMLDRCLQDIWQNGSSRHSLCPLGVPQGPFRRPTCLSSRRLSHKRPQRLVCKVRFCCQRPHHPFSIYVFCACYSRMFHRLLGPTSCKSLEESYERRPVETLDGCFKGPPKQEKGSEYAQHPGLQHFCCSQKASSVTRSQ